MTNDDIEQVVVETLMEFVRPDDANPDPEGEPITDALRDTLLSQLGVELEEIPPLAQDIELALGEAGLLDFEFAPEDLPTTSHITVRELVALTVAVAEDES